IMFLTIHKRAKFGGILDDPMVERTGGQTRSRYRVPEARAELPRSNADFESSGVQEIGLNPLGIGVRSDAARACLRVPVGVRAPMLLALIERYAAELGFRFSPITLKKS